MSGNQTKSLSINPISSQLDLPLQNEVENPLQPQVLSVEQLNLQIKQMLEGELPLLWVKGEISNFKKHSSGHFYFSLKDAKSQISAVMFRGHNMRLKFNPNDGLEVLVRGRISVYEPRGNYQIVCDMMEPVGAGALQKAFEQLKIKLKNEGLFDPARKRALPTFPKHIAVVTSPTGAAIRDILNILKRRAPSIQVTVVPTVVQGEGASRQIIAALEAAQKLKNVDVIICGRGGGSIEDMWCFNDEALARAVAQSRVPVVSAVGHEIDFTICDFVADLRAPTPSAAAELVAKSTTELSERVLAYRRLLEISFLKKFNEKSKKLELLLKQLVDPRKKLQDLRLRNDDLLNRLEFAFSRHRERRLAYLKQLSGRLVHPKNTLLQSRQKIGNLQQKMDLLIKNRLTRSQDRVNKIMDLLDSLSPLKVVQRGYSMVFKGDELVKTTKQVEINDELQIHLATGKLKVKVETKE